MHTPSFVDSPPSYFRIRQDNFTNERKVENTPLLPAMEFLLSKMDPHPAMEFLLSKIDPSQGLSYLSCRVDVVVHETKDGEELQLHRLWGGQPYTHTYIHTHTHTHTQLKQQ